MVLAKREVARDLSPQPKLLDLVPVQLRQGKMSQLIAQDLTTKEPLEGVPPPPEELEERAGILGHRMKYKMSIFIGKW